MKTTGQDFLRATCYENISPSPQEKGMPQPPLELPIPTDAELIPLPGPASLDLPGMDLRKAIEQRRSRRKYQDTPLTLDELSFLLWLTQGVKKISTRPATLRTVPSAGSRHAFETYLSIQKVEGLEPGLYRFTACEHALLRLDAPETIHADITHACWDQKQIANSAVTFLWAAVVERMTWRYVERGYRYLYLDAGHVCQNLYLAAEALHCGVCAIAAFNDEELNSTLKLDGENMFVIYLASLGKQ